MIQGQRDLDDLIGSFVAEDRAVLRVHVQEHDEMLSELVENPKSTTGPTSEVSGILALNGASGAGQSYVMERIETILANQSIVLPRIYLLATRSPRPGERHKEPYIFVERTESGFRDIFRPEVAYHQNDIYYFYESRPGAENAILLADARAAMDQTMYLETVIPTLLHIKTTQIGEVPPWGERLRIVYLAAPSGQEWMYRLLNREPSKLTNEEYRANLMGRARSSIVDMREAVKHKVPTVLNHYGEGDLAAKEVLSIWGFQSGSR